MKYEVNVVAAVIADLEDIYERISRDSADAAGRTVSLLRQAIESLDEFPLRYAVAPETKGAAIEIRHMIVGNYRVLYSVLYQTVRVWRVVHSARILSSFELM